MKKFLLFTIVAIVCTSVAMAQHWVALTGNEPAQPEINLLTSTQQHVRFTVHLSGFYATLKMEGGVNYQRLYIPGHRVAGETGEPEIPVITQSIAVPVCSSIAYSVQVTATQTLWGYRVYPVPDMQPNLRGELEEVFTINPLSYLQNAFTPTNHYSITETGAMREQHFVTIELHPVQFNPATGALQIATEMEITLTFNNPATEVNVNTGIFNNVATHTLLNYEDRGILKPL
jgi:hypothetical protein